MYTLGYCIKGNPENREEFKKINLVTEQGNVFPLVRLLIVSLNTSDFLERIFSVHSFQVELILFFIILFYFLFYFVFYYFFVIFLLLFFYFLFFIFIFIFFLLFIFENENSVSFMKTLKDNHTCLQHWDFQTKTTTK